MRPARSQLEREHWLGVGVGVLAAAVVGLATYPPLVFGLVIGTGAGVGLVRGWASGGRQSPGRGAVLVAGAILAAGLGLADVVGLGDQRRAFLEAWTAEQGLRFDLDALTRYPWAWLPQSAAIAALGAGIIDLVGRRR